MEAKSEASRARVGGSGRDQPSIWARPEAQRQRLGHAPDSRWQEVATKLDSPKAYEEMGDKDGARELLKEVVKEGDTAQQQQAQTMLQALRLATLEFPKVIGASSADCCFRGDQNEFAIGVSYCGAGLEVGSRSLRNTVQGPSGARPLEIAGEPISLTAADAPTPGCTRAAPGRAFRVVVGAARVGVGEGVTPCCRRRLRCQWASPVAEDFHARYSALSRTYRYVLYATTVRPTLLAGRAEWSTCLWISKHEGSRGRSRGEHDFSAFARGMPGESPIRTSRRRRSARAAPYVVFDSPANAFLHHMIRNIVGFLVYVGKGKYPPAWMSE